MGATRNKNIAFVITKRVSIALLVTPRDDYSL